MDNLPRLISAFAAATHRAESTVCRLAGGRGDVAERARTGRISIRRAARIAQWLSDHWPSGADWPADIPRPAPAPDSPAGLAAAAAAAPPPPPADPVATVRALLDRHSDLLGEDPVDWAEAARVEAERHRVAMALGAGGEIASPKALCLAIGVSYDVYEDVVRRYADTATGPRPRLQRTSDARKMLTALVGAGDVRFARQRRRVAA